MITKQDQIDAINHLLQAEKLIRKSVGMTVRLQILNVVAELYTSTSSVELTARPDALTEVSSAEQPR